MARAFCCAPVICVAAATRQHKLQQRCSRGEQRGSNASVAAVYTTAPFVRTPEQLLRELHAGAQALPVERPRPRAKRVWASVAQTPQEIIRQACAESQQRDPTQARRWAVLVDGSGYTAHWHNLSFENR